MSTGIQIRCEHVIFCTSANVHFATQSMMCREEQMDPQTEEALVASKVDYLSEEYNQLLVSQLNQQRAYFENRLQQQAEEIEEMKRQAQDMCRKQESASVDARTSDRARRAVEQRMVRCMCLPRAGLFSVKEPCISAEA